MIIQYFLLLQVVLHLSAYLEGLLNTFLNRGVAVLELIHNTMMLGQILSLEQVLALAWIVLSPSLKKMVIYYFTYIDRIGNFFDNFLQTVYAEGLVEYAHLFDLVGVSRTTAEHFVLGFIFVDAERFLHEILDTRKEEER